MRQGDGYVGKVLAESMSVMILRTHPEKPEAVVHTCKHSTEKVKAEGTGKSCTPKQERDCCLQ